MRLFGGVDDSLSYGNMITNEARCKPALLFPLSREGRGKRSGMLSDVGNQVQV
jgi:hypothetical protein